MRATVELRGATALVTGAGSGIGRATAVALAREGSTVICVDLDEATAKTTRDSCRDHGADSTVHRCDVADPAAMNDLAAQVTREHGPLGLLVNNAGVGMTGGFVDTSLEDWEWIRSVNLDGVVHGCHAFGPAMVAAGRGHIVNISSGLAYVMHSTEVAYCTTKAAVLAFSRCLRSDWARHGVGVSAVCPGVINTPILQRTRFLGEMSSMRTIAEHAFRRGHSPDIVADAVIHAVRSNRAVVPAGFEARLGWHLNKVLPVFIADLLGRPAPARILRRAGR